MSISIAPWNEKTQKHIKHVGGVTWSELLAKKTQKHTKHLARPFSALNRKKHKTHGCCKPDLVTWAFYELYEQIYPSQKHKNTKKSKSIIFFSIFLVKKKTQNTWKHRKHIWSFSAP